MRVVKIAADAMRIEQRGREHAAHRLVLAAGRADLQRNRSRQRHQPADAPERLRARGQAEAPLRRRLPLLLLPSPLDRLIFSAATASSALALLSLRSASKRACFTSSAAKA